jgi:hypothetical protein
MQVVVRGIREEGGNAVLPVCPACRGVVMALLLLGFIMMFR